MYFRLSSDIRALDVPAHEVARVALLEEDGSNTAFAVDRTNGYEQQFFHLGYEDGQASTHSYDSSPIIWLYSLITTDYHSSQLMSHQLKHYRCYNIGFLSLLSRLLPIAILSCKI